MRWAENIACEPHLNAAIEQSLARMHPDQRAPYLDALEMIKDLGAKGTTRKALAMRLLQLYPGMTAIIDKVVAEADRIFPTIIHHQHNRLVWSAAQAEDDTDEQAS